MLCSDIWFDEYDGGYSSMYDGGLYDQNFVFYDENEIYDDDSSSGDSEDDGFDDDIEQDDIIMEEIPFVRCPTRDDEVGVA